MNNNRYKIMKIIIKRVLELECDVVTRRSDHTYKLQLGVLFWCLKKKTSGVAIALQATSVRTSMNLLSCAAEA